ncbi:MAG: c-type cytochrome [Phycisphaerae bacterium]
MSDLRSALFVLLAAILLTGCGGGGEEALPSTGGSPAAIRSALVAEGRTAYATYCVGCHGVAGDGQGPAAVFLDPKPRDFRLAKFKFSSTRSGMLPTDGDLKRTIRRGLRGSAMPGWKLLPTGTVEALVAYIKTFSPKWTSSRRATPIPRVGDPYRFLVDKAEAIKRGEAVYHGFATCWTCHPSYLPVESVNAHLIAMENPPRSAFRDNLFESEGKPNENGEMIYPPDFRRDYVRSGSTVEDLYRSVAAGITGTAMPTWVDSMDYASSIEGRPPVVRTADLWALAYYVQHLIRLRPSKLTPELFAVRRRRQVIYLHGGVPEPPGDVGGPARREEFDEFEEP